MSTNIKMFPTSLPYESMAAQLLMTDDIEKGELPRYQRDITVKAYVIQRRGQVPTIVVEAEELLVPTIEIATAPTIRRSEINRTEFDLEQQAEVHAEEAIRCLLDTEALKVINAACPQDQNETTINDLRPADLLRAAGRIAAHRIPVAAIIVNPECFSKMLNWTYGENECKLFNYKARSLRKDAGIQGSFDDIPVWVSSMCPKNVVFVLTSPEFLGVMPVKKHITKLEDDGSESNRIRTQNVFYTEVGFGIINDYGIAKITLCSGDGVSEAK